MEKAHFTAWNWVGIVAHMIGGFLTGFAAQVLWVSWQLLIAIDSSLLFAFFFVPPFVSGLMVYGLARRTASIKPDATNSVGVGLRRARRGSFAAFFVAGLVATLSQSWWTA